MQLEQTQSEYEAKAIESNEDKCELGRQLHELRREQRSNDEKQIQIIQELTEANFKLSKDLQIVRIFSIFRTSMKPTVFLLIELCRRT